MSSLRTANAISFLALHGLCRITHGAFASINPMPINTVAHVHPEPPGADWGRRHISSPSSLSASIYVQAGGNSYAGHLRLTGWRGVSQKMEGGKKGKAERKGLLALPRHEEPPHSPTLSPPPLLRDHHRSNEGNQCEATSRPAPTSQIRQVATVLVPPVFGPCGCSPR